MFDGLKDNRRAFLQRIAAGALAVATPLPTEGMSMPSVTASSEELRGWRWFRVSRIRPMRDDDILVMYLTAQRSDGRHFYVHIPMYREAFTPEQLSADFENALHTLETFRDCACGPGVQCETHQEMFPPASLEDEEEDEDA